MRPLFYTAILFALGIFMITLLACTPADLTIEEYGFGYGIWHGLSSFFNLVGSWFGADVGLYALNNSGFFYWVGYVIGVFFLIGLFSALPPLNLIVLILLILGWCGVV